MVKRTSAMKIYIPESNKGSAERSWEQASEGGLETIGFRGSPWGGGGVGTKSSVMGSLINRRGLAESSRC